MKNAKAKKLPLTAAAPRKRARSGGRSVAGGTNAPAFDVASMNRVALAVRKRADARRAARIISDDVIGQPVSV